MMAALGAVMGLMSRYGGPPAGSLSPRRASACGWRRCSPVCTPRSPACWAACSWPPTCRAGRPWTCGAPVPRLPPVAGVEVGPVRPTASSSAPCRSTSVSRSGCAPGPATWSCRCSRSPTPASTCATGSCSTPWVAAHLGRGGGTGHRQVPRHRPGVLGRRTRRSGRLPRASASGTSSAGPALSGIGFTVSLLIAGLAFPTTGNRPGSRRHPHCGGARDLLGWVVFRATGRGQLVADHQSPQHLHAPIEPVWLHLTTAQDLAEVGAKHQADDPIGIETGTKPTGAGVAADPLHQRFVVGPQRSAEEPGTRGLSWPRWPPARPARGPRPSDATPVPARTGSCPERSPPGDLAARRSRPRVPRSGARRGLRDAGRSTSSPRPISLRHPPRSRQQGHPRAADQGPRTRSAGSISGCRGRPWRACRSFCPLDSDIADLPVSNQHATGSDSNQSYSAVNRSPPGGMGIQSIRYALRTDERFTHLG